MDKNEILLLLKKKLKNNGLKLPGNIDFGIMDKTLTISLGVNDSLSCTSNLQTDEAAFEGWAICLKHHLCDYIDSVRLSWIKPGNIPEKDQLHYNRFLYRVIRFRQLFGWFEIAEINNPESIEFESKLTGLTINAPMSESPGTMNSISAEKRIEHCSYNLDFIRERFDLLCVNHQLPVGVRRDEERFFSGRASAIDIWGIDQQGKLNIFELKHKNAKVGIISELLFYSEIMYDLFVSGQIGKPGTYRKIRGAEYLYGNRSGKIDQIKSFFLFDRIHPLVAGTTALLNTNKPGIQFFNIQYKLNLSTYQMTGLYFKGGLQLEEEIRQSYFRDNHGLRGSSYVLNSGDANLHDSIRQDAIDYFSQNNIAWWTYNETPEKPSGHMVSSQIQCLNFLFPFRKNKTATLMLARVFNPEIDDVLPVIGDKDPGYIAFEFTVDKGSLLGENDKSSRRGAYCTSVDAFIIATSKRRKVLIPVEWKFTENYLESISKALEGSKGKTRQTRYNQLIHNSLQLKIFPDLSRSIYYYEPFYELMRQTLLAEQMVRRGLADEYLHVLVAPKKNADLLEYKYPLTGKTLEPAWQSCLNLSSRFRLIYTRQILELIQSLPGYSELYKYLEERYGC